MIFKIRRLFFDIHMVIFEFQTKFCGFQTLFFKIQRLFFEVRTLFLFNQRKIFEVWNKCSNKTQFEIKFHNNDFSLFLLFYFCIRDISIYDWDIIETSILKIDITISMIRNIRIIDRDILLLEKNEIYLFSNRFILKWLPLDSNPRSSYHELYLLQANPLRIFISKV